MSNVLGSPPTGDPAQKDRKSKLQALINSRLGVYNRQRELTPGDGNCQFIAVARGLGLSDGAHVELRARVVAYLMDHREEFEGFQEGGSWDAYIAYMSAPHPNVGWGDHVTLTVLTRIYKCEIQVVTDKPGQLYVNTITPPIIEKGRITIAHYDEVHYESTVAI